MTWDPTNRGSLFKADKKGNPKRPDYNGTLNVDGKDYELAGWVTEAKSKLVYVSLKVQPKRGAKQGPDSSRPAPADARDGFIPDEEIPF